MVRTRGGNIEQQRQAGSTGQRDRPHPRGALPAYRRGGGVVSITRTTPTHAEQQGGAGDATRRRGAAFTRRQPRAATAEDARPPPRPGNPHQTTGACVTPGGARAHAREGAPRERQPSSGEGGHTGAKTPRRGCHSAAGRAAPSAAQAARQGVRSDREGASPERAGEQQARRPVRGERGAPRRREHEPRRGEAPRCKRGGGDSSAARRRQDSPASPYKAQPYTT